MKLLLPAITALVLASATLGAQAAPSPDLMGEAVSADSAQRTVVINQATRWVNVTQGETVKFVSNGSEFTFAFDGESGAIGLAQIAPAGASIDHAVRVYVARQAVSGSM
jgi:hypothetical protein